jgi:hypothetical protein
MAKGASVFKNTGCDGKTDLCFKYNGAVYEIDVKLAAFIDNGNGGFSWKSTASGSVKPPVYPLIVIPETGIDLSGWRCRWVAKPGKWSTAKKLFRCPPGLENFWD